jgi:DNA polymerase elongation subunit (family B)
VALHGRCIISREIGGQVLDLILSGKEKEEVRLSLRLRVESGLLRSVSRPPVHSWSLSPQVVESIHALLSTFAAESRAGSVPLEKFVITKGLNKAPKDYPDAKGQPHLQVAITVVLCVCFCRSARVLCACAAVRGAVSVWLMV